MPLMLKTPNTGDYIAQAGGQIAGAIAAIPENKRRSEDHRIRMEQHEANKIQQQKAIDALQEDWSRAEVSWKAFKEQTRRRAQPLVDAGIINADALESEINTLPMPRRLDSLDKDSIKSYFDKFVQAQNTLNTKIGKWESSLKQKQEQTGLGQQIATAKEGTPAELAKPIPVQGPSGQTQFTETDIGPDGKPVVTKPAVPPAVTQEQIASQLPAGTTMSQAKEQPGFATAPTQADLDKQALEKEKLEVRKKADEIKASVTSNSDWIRLQELALKKKIFELSEDKDDLARVAKRKDILRDQRATLAAVEELKEELKGAQQPDEISGEVDFVKVAELKQSIKDLEKMANTTIPALLEGTIRPGTTVNFQTGKTTPAQAPAAIPARPQTTQKGAGF